MNAIINRIICWGDTKYRSKFYLEPLPSIKFNSNDFHDSFQNGKNKTKNKISNILIFNIDSIDCAIQLIQSGIVNPLVLNLADDVFSGGCINSGSDGQEESIFRRTNYHLTLLQNMYPIKDDEAIYSPCVTIFKKSEEENWELLKTPLNMSFVACPAIKFSEVITFNNQKQLANSNDIEKLKKKIKLIINIARDNNHDAIVFSEMVCSAEKNLVEHAAKIFHEVLEQCDGIIENYVFAIHTTNLDAYTVLK